MLVVVLPVVCHVIYECKWPPIASTCHAGRPLLLVASSSGGQLLYESIEAIENPFTMWPLH